MSLNGLVEQTYLFRLATLHGVLDKYKSVWANANTVEEQLVAQADAVDLFLRLEKDVGAPSDVSEFEHLDNADLDEVYGFYEMLQKSNLSLTQVLTKNLLSKFNSYQLLFSDLTGQVRRIKQKKAVLSLWSGEKSKYFTGNRFLNIDGLNTDFTSLEANEVNTNQGLLTLPVNKRESLDIASIKLGSGSNGNAGNSDVAVTQNNQDLKALISNADTYFEYERLDQGPCKLVMIVDLQRPQIVNNVVITPIDIGSPLSFDVVDIIYTSSTKQSVSVHELVRGSDLFTVDAAAFNDGWEITHLPVEAVSVSIILEQTSSYPIRTMSVDKRLVTRDRFAIPLQRIKLNRIEYKVSGGINSVAVPIRKNLYAMEPVAKVWPSDTKFYDYVLEASFDGGSTWLTAGTDDANQVTLIPDNSGDFQWRLSLLRTTAAFNAFSVFANDVRGTINSVTKTTSRFVSPTTVSLPTATTGSVQVIQPKIGRRGSKDKAFRLGAVTTPGTNKLRIPFNVLKKRVRPQEVKLYVGGSPYLRKEPGESLSTVEWSFSDNHEEVIVSDLLPGVPVDIVLDDELMLLEERSDGYYHAVKLDFDPDKDNILINYLARTPSRKSVQLPRGETQIYLGSNNILANSMTLVSTTNVTYTEVATREEVYDAADNDFFADNENGILYLASAVTTDSVRASFDYQSKHELAQDGFDVIYTDNLPSHVRINKSVLEATTVTETISDANLPVIDPVSGTYGVRTEIIPNGSTKKKQLSNNYIIVNTLGAPTDLLASGLLPEEVTYIDGKTEFLGLTEVNEESTNTIQASASGVVSFELSARSLWYKDFDVVFSDTSVFTTKRTSSASVTSGATGDYFIDNNGVVFVQIGAGNTLTSGIKMSYYFKSPKFQGANKYSVDYENGILFTHTLLNQDAVITYKTAAYTMAYDIAKQLPSRYSVDSNSVEVKTELLDPVNNQIKVIWEESKQSPVDSTIQQYFSPLISLIGFKFS